MSETTYAASKGGVGRAAKGAAKSTVNVSVAAAPTIGKAVNSADNTILACVTGAVVVTYVGKITTKKPVTMRPLVGGFIAGTLLLLMALASDDIARMFAIIMLVSSLLVNGASFFDAIGRLTK